MKNDLRTSLVLHDCRVRKGFIPSVEDARRMLLCDSVGMGGLEAEFQGSNEGCFSGLAPPKRPLEIFFDFV